MMLVGTAPADTCSKAVRTTSSSGGTASAMIATIRSRVAWSLMKNAKIESTNSMPGSRAISAAYARPAASRPPPARSKTVSVAISVRTAARPPTRPTTCSAIARQRSTRGASSAVVMASAAQVLEQAALDVLDADASRGRDQRPDLAPPDVAPAAQLDARETARPRPGADGLRAKPDVRGGQDR